MADPRFTALGRSEMFDLALLLFYAGITWFAPNTQTLMGYDHDNRKVGGAATLLERPLFPYAMAVVLAAGVLSIQQHSEFIYFRF